MKIRPSGVPTTADISTSTGIDMSVAYSLISMRVWLFGPGAGCVETPIRRTVTGVHITSRDVISSMKTPLFGFTRATCVITSGWSTKELSSWLCQA